MAIIKNESSNAVPNPIEGYTAQASPEVGKLTSECENMTQVAIGGKLYGYIVDNSQGDDHTDFELYNIIVSEDENEEDVVGSLILSMFTNKGHSGVSLSANGDTEDVPGISFEDLKNLITILEDTHKGNPVQFLYI